MGLFDLDTNDNTPERLSLHDVSADKGKTWTTQWLTPTDILRHRMDGYVTRPHSVDSLIHAPHCAQHAIHDPHGIWCGKNQKAVETMDGSTGVCEQCSLNSSIGNMSLKARCERIRQIDVALHNLFEEQRKLYHDGLSQEQSDRLDRMVMSDGKPHFT